MSDPSGWRERAKVVWEEANGPIPKGCVIHHKDRDTLNDIAHNLEAMTRAEHLAEHRAEHLTVKATRQPDWLITPPAPQPVQEDFGL